MISCFLVGEVFLSCGGSQHLNSSCSGRETFSTVSTWLSDLSLQWEYHDNWDKNENTVVMRDTWQKHTKTNHSGLTTTVQILGKTTLAIKADLENLLKHVGHSQKHRFLTGRSFEAEKCGLARPVDWGTSLKAMICHGAYIGDLKNKGNEVPPEQL